MDFKEIEQLIALVEESKISSFKIEEGDTKIEIKKQEGQFAPFQQSYEIPAQAQMTQLTQAPAVSGESAAPSRDENLIAITSPMVGTFYAAPNPEEPSFVKVGDTVSVGTVVCVVEAMKLFNEIESEITGVVEKVLVNNASPVEYGQELFLIRV